MRFFVANSTPQNDNNDKNLPSKKMTKKLAFVFPGQGSQSVGMLHELAQRFPIIEATFAEATNVLGYDLWQLAQIGPDVELNRTEKTQPALLASSVALWRIWQTQHGLKPKLLAGHSLGEYSALVCADALNFADALQLVAERGKLMQQAVPEGIGAMAAIVGLENEHVQKICVENAANEILSPANFNAIGQTVIAGHAQAVKRAVAQATEQGAKMAKLLPISVPSHCALMKPAAEQLAIRLEHISLRTPKIPVVHNKDVNLHSHPDDIRAVLVAQLYSPVRWVETVLLMVAEGMQLAVECGPGKVLSGLGKRISDNLPTLPIYTVEQLLQVLEQQSE
jgi:[acyl-carrier-protein] S-malonyltransferase